MRTFVASTKRADTKWHVIDANGQVLGRVATLTVRLLQGKHKASYTPFIDTGDHVVIINAGAVKLTGRKEQQKVYRRHSGYEGGLKEVRARGGVLYVFADGDSRVLASDSVNILRLPANRGQLSPILHVVPLHLLAYHVALRRGLDVDKPRNLAKSVTVE